MFEAGKPGQQFPRDKRSAIVPVAGVRKFPDDLGLEMRALLITGPAYAGVIGFSGSGAMTMAIESPLIGSGSQEEVDNRVNALIDLGKSRGYLTYDELNE